MVSRTFEPAGYPQLWSSFRLCLCARHIWKTHSLRIAAERAEVAFSAVRKQTEQTPLTAQSIRAPISEHIFLIQVQILMGLDPKTQKSAWYSNLQLVFHPFCLHFWLIVDLHQQLNTFSNSGADPDYGHRAWKVNTFTALGKMRKNFNFNPIAYLADPCTNIWTPFLSTQSAFWSRERILQRGRLSASRPRGNFCQSWVGVGSVWDGFQPLGLKTRNSAQFPPFSSTHTIDFICLKCVPNCPGSCLHLSKPNLPKLAHTVYLPHLLFCFLEEN